MDSFDLIPHIAAVIFVGMVIYAIIIGIQNHTAHKRRMERYARIRKTLMSMSYTCDGRSLRIPRPSQWDDNEQVSLSFYPEMRQVFHITVPGHKTITRYNDIGGTSWPVPQIEIPRGFNIPTAITPRPVNPTTTAHLREEIMPYLAAELNLSQEDINSTTIELKGHEIRYTIEYRYITVGHTPWVSYRPNATA